MHVFYIHGFASSAHSSKARWLAERLAAHGLALHCPDLNEPEFSTLTVTRMIERVEAEIGRLPAGPVTLIGSSLGAFVAVQVAARCPPGTLRAVERMILLAPALDFPDECERTLGAEGFERWRTTGRVDVFHYAYGEMRTLQYALYEDAKRYDPFALSLTVPVLIIQGRFDRSVDVSVVERFARDRPHVKLQMVDDDHQLLESLEILWNGVAGELGLITPGDSPGSSSSPSS